MMRPSADVADKAVSTEDLQREAALRAGKDGGEGREPVVTNTALELVRLEAVLTALVASKVIAIKAAGKAKKAATRPRSLSSGHQGKLQRLTSTSTASSSHQESLVQNPPLTQSSQPQHQQKRHHHHHHHHHHHQHHRNHHHKHKRQSDSALLSSGLLFPKKRYRNHHIKSHELDENGRGGEQIHSHCHDCKQIDNETNGIYSEEYGDGLRTKSATNLAETTFSDENETGSRYSLNEHMNTGHGPSTSCQNSPFHTSYPNYSYNPVTCNNQTMVSTSCCPTPTNSQSKILVSRGDADHVSLNMEPDEDEDEDEDEEEQAARRRKRKRRRKNRMLQERSDQVLSKRPKRIDPEDLPKRARWTIIATACLLLLMSVLLVGVTLRMAPIIDEMVRKENEQMMNPFGDEDHLYNATLETSSTTNTST